jgi:transcriptional regulator with PAS, ATPase and Fis domain
MSNVIDKARRFANSDCTVLLRGDSGTGKELVAQSMHNAHSTRGKRSFVAVNCASLDNNLLKSELFGYVEGAFTGAAKKGRAGLFELAHGGTIFLDEIGKIKLDIQAILLRVIQEKEIIRIGSDRVIPVDVRIIAATNENLEELIEKGQFLQDLYFRLNVLKLNIPTLKERREDIPPLVKAILGRLSNHYGKNITTFQSVVFKKLMQLDWPGNIRQLEYLIERCVVLADDEKDASRIMIEIIGEEFSNAKKEDRVASDGFFDDYVMVQVDTLQNMERQLVHKLSLQGKQNKTELALILGISRPTLWKLLGDKNID